MTTCEGSNGASIGRVGDVRDVRSEVESRAAQAEIAARYLQVVEMATDVVYTADLDRRITWVAPSVTDTIGFTAEDLLGSVTTDLVHPEDLIRIDSLRDRILDGTAQRTEAVIGRLRTKAGGWRWLAIHLAPEFDAAGRPTGVIGALHDVDDLVRSRQEEQAGRATLRATLDSLLDPHVRLEAVRDQDGRIVDFDFVDANEAASRYLAIPEADLIGTRASVVWPHYAEEGLFAMCTDVVRTGAPLVLDDFPTSTEEPKDDRHYDIRGVKVGDGVSYTWRDVTERIRAQFALVDSEARYRLIAENALDVVIRSDHPGVITWVSPSVTEVLGWTPAELIGRTQQSLINPDDLAVVQEIQKQAVEAGRDQGDAELRYATKDGGWRWVRMHGRALRDEAGTIIGGIDSLRDIDDEVETRGRLAFEVDHDSLTHLVTRTRLLERLGAERMSRPESCALLCVAVDDIGVINDAYTHTVGDRVLVTVAERLVAAVGERDRIGRTADNEFSVLLTELSPGADLLDLITRLQGDVSVPVRMGAETLAVTVSIGIASDHGGDALELLRDASTAMHRAKARGGNRWEFADPTLAEQAKQRLRIQSGLRDALANGQIRAWYQPIVALPDGRLRGYEALARWVRMDGSVVPPDDFIPIAERGDMIVDLDREMLRQALASLHDLPSAVHMAVNFSATTLSAPDMVANVTRLLGDAALNPRRLHLEVTETALLRVTETIQAGMRSLANLGVTWWVDDFGTGYSSLTHLRDMPVQGLKLDRSFTSGITGDDPTHIRLAQGLVGLAQGLGLVTIAEGVESQNQADILAAQGWEHAQGWLYGKPTARPDAAGIHN